MKTVKFSATKKELETISLIVDRAVSIFGEDINRMEVSMDLNATHSNGCPLDFEKLLGFDDFNFIHDVSGICGYIDRRTGELTNCFLPKCSKIISHE